MPLGERIVDWLIEKGKLHRRMRFIPPMRPLKYRRVYKPPIGPWGDFAAETPEGLLGVPGIRRDPEAEEAAQMKDPLQDLHELYPKGHRAQVRKMLPTVIPALPRQRRSWVAVERAESRARARTVLRPLAQFDPASLTKDVKAKSAEIGLSAIGIAQYDPKYTFAPFLGREVGDRVIICVLEQVYQATQAAPNRVAERAAFFAYSEVMKLGIQLAAYLRDLGYQAISTTPHSTGVMIHYAVEAGLGQLGHNGQLLTPFAGSRCRLVSISTDAPLEFDQPRDYGIHKICEMCQACVRRCPGNAIPRRRAYYRGVEKAKINTARCMPLVSQAEGCAVCMKVCPVQRYGLAAVYDEYEKSGEILGTETEDLEGFTFTDGRHYGPGEMPKLPPEYFFDIK